MLSHAEALRWLREGDPDRLEALWQAADRVRRDGVGDAVHLRGLVEISNHCVRRCAYCGINAANAALERYRMDADEILACAREAVALRCGTVVLQAGEDHGLAPWWVAELVRRIKGETGLAVTLSLGERENDDLAAWRRAGADRYLLRFETSDAELYRRIHPPYSRGAQGAPLPILPLPRAGTRRAHERGHRADSLSRGAGEGIGSGIVAATGANPHPRLAILRRLRELGYEIGSGVMIGIPGQGWASLADDILAFAALDLDMIGVGPFLPHPATPLGSAPATAAPNGDQVPNDELTTYKVIALARLACPEANIPATTGLATLNRATGRELGLGRGANVVMPNLTPPRYRFHYEIYPHKACLLETGATCAACLAGRITRLGRAIASGPGGRRREALTLQAEALDAPPPAR